jgi:glycyl-tRNA synthetase beta chain
VATAIHEHYLPRYPGDALPKTKQGSLLSIADKLDTIVGGFIAGYVPTGSQDPQGLRRCATGVIAVIGGSTLSLSLRGLVAQSIDAYKGQKLFGKHDDVEDQVLNFFKTRVENWLQEQGFRYDLVDAVLSADYDDPCDAKSRVSALRTLHSSSDFVKLITTQKRVTNILRGQPQPPPLRESLLADKSEFRLLSAIKKLEPKYRESLRTSNYSRALRHLLSLRIPIDRFFDEVLVMAEEKRLRMNRLALLKYTQNLFSEIGDLSKIVVE